MTISSFYDDGDPATVLAPAPAPQTGFEGPEKRLEVWFKENPQHEKGLRQISREKWQLLLNSVNCIIMSHTSNDFMDSYVLSESSLFVYPFKIMVKTCGTTTLLNCLPGLKEYAAEYMTEIEYLVFSRKNYNFPQKQNFPHTNFQTEVEKLQEVFDGSAHIIGPVMCKSDHHYIFVSGSMNADVDKNHFYKHRPSFEMLMSELDPSAMKQFFKDESFIDSKTVTAKCGLSNILPDMVIDDVMFDPCGYSCNAICATEDSYFTVHVTPEAHCSFVSFETNASSASAVQDLLQRVAKVFRPGRFSLVLSSPFGSDNICLPAAIPLHGYLCKYRSYELLQGGLCVSCFNYTLERTGAPIGA